MISSFSSLPGLKYGTFFGGTSTLSPVLGFRPLRGSRRRRKLPNPRSSIFSPRWSAVMMLRKTVSTMTSECFLVRNRDPGDFLHELGFGHAPTKGRGRNFVVVSTSRPYFA